MREIPLTRGFVARVDDSDYEELSRSSWHVGTPNRGAHTRYAYRKVCRDGRWQHESMHRAILGEAVTHEVDHRDGDGLNNQRTNLRPATHAQNMANRVLPVGVSGFIGVGKTGNTWRAKIMKDGKPFDLGRHSNPLDAARAYDTAARILRGEFARVNFPEVIPSPDEKIVLPLPARHTSGRRGVSLDPKTNRWRARIRRDGRQATIGHFADINDAARAYDAAAKELRGERLRLNFPEVSVCQL